MPERIPPHSEDSEKSLLGSVLIDSLNVVPKCEERELSENDFYVPAHQTIWKAMSELSFEAKPIDSVTVSERLKHNGELERVGGNKFIDDLIDQCPTSAHAEFYLKTIKTKAKARTLIRLLRENGEKIYATPDDEVDDVVNIVHDELFKATHTTEEPMTLLNAANILIKRWKAAKTGEYPGLPCFLPEMNKSLGCFRYGQLYFIGAVPKAGKTTLVEQQLKHWAYDLQVPVAGISLEMTTPDFVGRIWCEQADVSMFALDMGYQEKPGFPLRIAEVRNVIKDWFNADMSQKIPLYLADRRMNIVEICSWVRMMVRKHSIKAVCVDYLQLIETPDSLQNKKEYEKIALIVGRLRDLARELGIVVLVVAQLTKEARKALHGNQKFKPERPSPDDILGGSIILNAAYGVMMMYEWPSDILKDNEGVAITELVLDLQAHRGGITGQVILDFVKNRQRIRCKGADYGTGNESAD